MDKPAPNRIRPGDLEVWGGVECSRVRIGDRIVDQLARTGHDRRIEDLERFAEIGIRALRYPVLWEHHWSGPGGEIDWRWADARLPRLRELGIRPIVGLVHHGSGPLPGGLLDPGFVAGLAEFAGRVAERYPWVDAYTPINEPATTARFSGLYGIWHPHGRGEQAFARCLMNQYAATRAAMAAIRAVNPAAQLIQTEDVGKVHSTALLAYQAEFENERRWLTFDVLTGQLDRSRPLWEHLRGAGITEAELQDFLERPCPPDVLGMNYYVTSERLLDQRLERYPACTHGGNGRENYADVPAVRARAEGVVGPAGLLRELWSRYHRPIAITEIQLACVRDEQLRWLHEAWTAAGTARAEGIEVRAVTAWALLGSFDWDSLLCLDRGSYETGAFDIRGAEPRPTAVATALRMLSRGERPAHPALAAPGWWRREDRLLFPAVAAPDGQGGTAVPPPEVARRVARARPLLILGANGTVGSAFVRMCAHRALRAVGLSRRQLDITDRDAVRDTVRRLQPWAVVNCAGYGQVDAAEQAREICTQANVAGPIALATACAGEGVRLVTFSTHHVFDGAAQAPYVESDPPSPLNHYGRSKHAAEAGVRELCPEALVVRTGVVFGPWDDVNFVTTSLRQLINGRRVRAASDFIVSPVYVPDLVDAVLDLLIDGESGLWHLVNQGNPSWYDWAFHAAEAAGCGGAGVIAASPEELGWVAPRPRSAALTSERATLLAPWQNALQRYAEAAPWRRQAAA